MSTTKIYALIAGITTFLGWFVTLPPEQQNLFIAPIIAVIPPAAQSWIGLVLKIVGSFYTIAFAFRLRNNQPPTPPPNP